jgi:hypothetical protein
VRRRRAARFARVSFLPAGGARWRHSPGAARRIARRGCITALPPPPTHPRPHASPRVTRPPAGVAPRYLVLFLKFIASVVPTIQYDYTMSVGGE